MSVFNEGLLQTRNHTGQRHEHTGGRWTKILPSLAKEGQQPQLLTQPQASG